MKPINHIQDWVTARKNATPEKVFLFHGDDQLSFRALNRLVQEAYTIIQAHEFIKPGDKVAILMPTSVRYVATVLALMQMQAIVVPLNTRLTPDELKWQIRNTDCRMVICNHDTEDLASKLYDPAYEIVSFDKSTLEYVTSLSYISPKVYNDDALVEPIELDAEFAIIHTSGTSGRPKGAILTYNNIYQSAMASAYRIGVMPNDRWLCVLPLFHVGGLSIIMRSLLYGISVELISKFDIDVVNHVLTHHPITLVSLVPTMLHRLLDARTEPWNPNLRLVLLGGGAPSPELVTKCIEEGIPLATTYGLTEVASQVATAALELVSRKPASVGKPLMFTQVRVVDGNGEDMPPNEIGEIIVKGPSVMKGYYNDSKSTAKALRDGWLHTGDMGYQDEDEDLFVVQRRSDLIVTGGENVYPAEVENVIRQHPDVRELVVLGLDNIEWGQKVVAAIQLHETKNLSSDDIVRFAREQLAGYKIPREIRFVDEFPQTGSGKIQRNKVRKVFEDAPVDG